jgi:alkanesulfonate monooxygenase SsuD/methylene tetrahydromethanopterin reductase-like flavin-dependent oxidoreductase (luciferase family)
LAALGQRTTRVAAEVADGWLPIFLTHESVVERTRVLTTLRLAAGIRSQPLTVATGPIAVVDDDPETARNHAASLIAWYLCAMGNLYSQAVSAQGYADAVQAIQAANPRPRPGDGVVPYEAEPLLDELAAYGTSAQVADRLTQWDQVADIVTIAPPPGLAWDTLEATLRAAAPSLSNTAAR